MSNAQLITHTFNHEQLNAVASMLVVNAGHVYEGLWSAGTDESTFIHFITKAGTAYALEFFNVDEPFEALVYRGYSPAGIYEAFSSEDEDEQSKVDTAIIWKFRLETEPEVDYLGDSFYVHGLGVLATFLYELREGKVA